MSSSRVDRPLKETAAVIGMTPVKFLVEVSCDSKREVYDLSQLIEHGQVGDMEVVEVDGRNWGLTLWVEAEGERTARSMVEGLIEKAGLTESAVIMEVAAPGFEGTVKKLKAHKDVDNPWALSWYMHNKGFKSHVKSGKRSRKRKHQREDLQEADWKQELQAFLDHPWQEDTEIEFIRLVREYWDNPKYQAVASQFWKNYLKRLAQNNRKSLLPKTSDGFMDHLDRLTESLHETTTTAAVPTLPWAFPPLEGLKFSDDEKKGITDHIKRMYPNMSDAELRKSIFGSGKKE